MSSAVVGTIVDLADGQFIVRFPGGLGEVPARCTLALSAAEAAELVARGASVVLLLEGNNPCRPIVTGLVHDRAVRATAPAAAAEPARTVTATLDGQRVVLEAADEIVLQCGEASITLRRNGRIIIRGTHLESRSKGVNRIRGGSVQIN